MPACQPQPRLPSLQYEKDPKLRPNSEDPRDYMNDPDYVPYQDIEELYRRFDDLVSEARPRRGGRVSRGGRIPLQRASCSQL